MTEDELHFKKYKSNGDIPQLIQHYCICCKKLKNDIEIFTFTDNSIGETWVGSTITPNQYNTLTTVQPSATHFVPSNYPSGSIFNGQNTAYRPAKQNTIFLCAECLYKLSQMISPESIANMVEDKL